MASCGARQGPFPRASAELTGSFLSTRNDVLMSATITVDFGPVGPTNVTDDRANGRGDADQHPALLLTLSPLHRVCEVRVWLEKKGGPAVDGVGGWHVLEINRSTLFETRRRVLRRDSREVRSPSIAVTSDVGCVPFLAPQLNVMEQEVNGATTNADDDVDDNEVLELVFGSSDDDKASTREEAINQSEMLEDEESYSPGVQFMLRLCPFDAGGLETGDTREWFIARCCIEVGLLPLEQLTCISYPRLAIVSSAGPKHLLETMCETGDEDYVLLTGQRFYDYFICPRVAYSEDGVNAASFTALNVYVTGVRLLSSDMATQWEVLFLNALPVLPEDLVCAFVRPQRDDVLSIGDEVHAGVRWHVLHHPAYTLLSTEDGDYLGGKTRLYFFHCDHVLCDSLLMLVRAAYTAWEKVGSSVGLRTSAHVGTELPCAELTWVVTGFSSTLLSLRRGALCTCGAIVLAVDVLRAMQSCAVSATSINMFLAETLRAKAAVLSVALEGRWRMSAGSGVVPAFEDTSLNVALVRAWALCLLYSEFGWTELIRQERQIVFSSIFTTMNRDSWQLTQRYVQEAYKSLLVLSSTFAVASMCSHCCYPWQLLEAGNGFESLLTPFGESNVSISSGMHLHLVQILLQGGRQCMWQQHNGNVFLTPLVFVGTLCYEEAKDHATHRSITLCLKSTATHAVRSLLNSDMRATDPTWNIDVPFTIVFFVIEESEVSSTTAVSGRKEGKLCCRSTNILPCYWRVSGVTWARGLDQHTSFSILKTTPEDNTDAEEKSERMGREDENENSFLLHIPLLVLNSKIVPPALSLRVEHSQFWSGPASSRGTLARRILLQHVVEQAVREGENNVEEADLVFTPLLNQLLEGILLKYVHVSSRVGEDSPLSIFLSAFRGVNLSPIAVRDRIHPRIYTCFVRLVGRHDMSLPPVLASTLKRQRDSGETSRVHKDEFGLAARIIDHIRALEVYDATLPRARPEPRQELQVKPLRLVLNFKKRLVIRREEEEEEKKEKEVRLLPNPADLAAMVGRVIAASTELNAASTSSSARLAAFSLALPTWLLLHDQRDIPAGRRAALIEGARNIYASFQNNATAKDSDAFLLKAYECFRREENND